MGPALETLNARFGQLLDSAARNPFLAIALILGIALPAFLFGFIELPPIDRTEVRYAQVSKQMIESGDYLYPKFQTEQQLTFPIGIYWLQTLTSRLAGPDAIGQMWGYRLPSLIGVIAALLITYFGARRLVGDRAALIGVALLAINPVLIAQAHLALSKGMHLAFVAAAQWSLAWLYVGKDGASGSRTAVIFWLAQGLGVLTGTLSLPLLSLATIGGLLIYDRDACWLGRLRAHWGVPLAVLVVSPWLAALALNPEPDVVRQAWMSDLLNQLAGPQKVSRFGFPGMYSLGLAICLLSAVLLAGPAFKRLWTGREDRTQRFLLIWVLGYLAVAEPFFNKPPLYTIQMLLPAVTVAIGMLLAPHSGKRFDYRFHPANWTATLVSGLLPAIALIAFVIWQSRPIDVPAIVFGAIAMLCAVAAHVALRDKRPFAWLGLVAIAAVLVNVAALRFVLPDFRQIWSSGRLAEISRAIAPCIPDRVLVGGYVEPSAVFQIGTSTYVTKGAAAGTSAADWLAEKTKGRIVFVTKKVKADFQSQAKRLGLAPLHQVACTGGYNVGRIKWTDLELYVMATKAELAACPIPEHARCSEEN